MWGKQMQSGMDTAVPSITFSYICVHLSPPVPLLLPNIPGPAVGL